MTIIRQYIAPLVAILVFFAALVAVSARIFLPSDMAAPAPIEEAIPQKQAAAVHPIFLGVNYSPNPVGEGGFWLS
ncbi:MAG: hypothetical protein U7126_01565 [Microcoleus sp.]